MVSGSLRPRRPTRLMWGLLIPERLDDRGNHGRDKAVYFKWALCALMPVVLVLTVGFDPDVLDVYPIFGSLVLATVILLLLGVRTTRGMWIVGSILLGVVVIGLVLSLESRISPASLEDVSSAFWMVAILFATPIVALVGAVVDTIVRLNRK